MLNLDASTAIAFISEGSLLRHQLKVFVGNQPIVMTQMAFDEFTNILNTIAGPLEQARAVRLLSRVTIIPNNPSVRALNLIRTRTIRDNDVMIFRTAARLGIKTVSSDAKFVRAAKAQGIEFDVFLHRPQVLLGR